MLFLFFKNYFITIFIIVSKSTIFRVVPNIDALNRWELQYFLDAKDLVVCISSTGLDNLVNE